MQPPLSAGLVLQNRYRLLNLLGQGGFGRTYLAEDLGRFNERCALKEFIPSQSGNYVLEKSKELFQREAATLYQIQHPQIPQFRATFEENQRLFLVQDYVEGKTYRAILNDRIVQGLSFSEAEALQLLRQLLPVLAHIHARGIIHRDIAPDNIMLRQSDFLPVLIDFGVVKEIATRLQTATSPQSTTVGKLGYAPSEQMQTGRAYPSSDLYALAVTVVVLLTGREPQDLYDDMSLTWHWQRYANVHPGLAQVLNKMLSYRPGDRYQSVAEVAQALQALTHPAAMQPSVGQQPLPGQQPGMYAPTQPPTPSSDPFSEVQTVAVGRRPIPTTTAGGTTAGRGTGGNPRYANPSIPLPSHQSTSMWDNPLAVIAVGIGLAVVAGIASWAVVSAFLNLNNPTSTPSPTTTVAPSLMPSPTPTASPSLSPSPTPTPSPEQPVEFDQRLTVRPGSTTTTQGSLRGNQTINYLVSLEEGQRLSAAIDGNGVTMNVLTPDKQPVDQQSVQVLNWTGRADVTGDYIVQVKPVDGTASTDYALNLSLEDRPSPSPTPSPEPIPSEPDPGNINIQTNYVDFSPGQTVQEVSAQVNASLIQRYLVNLQPNQTLNVDVVQGNIRLRLRYPDGRLIDDASGGQFAQIGPGLPQAGDYQIDVVANPTVNFVIRISLTD